MDVAVSLTLGSKARWNASVPTTPTATSATAATIARIFFMARFLLDGNGIKGQDTTDALAPVLRQRAVEKRRAPGRLPNAGLTRETGPLPKGGPASLVRSPP
ncbi:hypothetical protein CE91St32_12130 [Gordonibacter pamelaeae]|nr:hypothetical protein CE91St32_12130 [Gordonibacter pamelaeae]